MELSAKAARRKAKTKSMEVQLQTLQQQMADFQSSMKDMASTIGSVKENVITEVKDLIAETNLKSMTDMRAVIEDKIARVKLRHDSNVGMMGDLCAGIVDYLIQKSGGQSSPESERLVEFMVASVQITSFLDEVCFFNVYRFFLSSWVLEPAKFTCWKSYLSTHPGQGIETFRVQGLCGSSQRECDTSVRSAPWEGRGW